MSEQSTAQAAESTASEETTTEEATTQDSDRWDDEPAQEDGEQESAQTEPKSEPKKEPKSKAETEKEEKKKAAKQERRFKKLLINGKEQIVYEDEAYSRYQKESAAEEKFRQTSEMYKKIEAFKEQFAKDPLSVLTDPNVKIDRRALGQRLLKETIAEELKDPLQAKIEALEAENRTFKEKEEQKQKEAEEQELRQQSEARRGELAKVFKSAMEASPLAQDPESAAGVLREMAMHARILKAQDPTAPIPTPEELVQHVETTRMKQFHTLANTLSGDQLIQFLGDRVVNEIRKADIAKIKKQRGVEEKPEVVEEPWGAPKKTASMRETIDPISMRDKVRQRIGLR